VGYHKRCSYKRLPRIFAARSRARLRQPRATHATATQRIAATDSHSAAKVDIRRSPAAAAVSTKQDAEKYRKRRQDDDGEDVNHDPRDVIPAVDTTTVVQSLCKIIIINLPLNFEENSVIEDNEINKTRTTSSTRVTSSHTVSTAKRTAVVGADVQLEERKYESRRHC
jgi:hypothetical protein